MITWITENVAIGEYTDAMNEELLEGENVDCILSLRGGEAEDSSIEEESLCSRLGISFFKVPIYDIDYQYKHKNNKEQTNIKIQCRTATYMLEQLTEMHERILVHCTAGIDRAPFVVASYLASLSLDFDRTVGLNTVDFESTFRSAYKFIKRKRPQIIEHYEWV